MRKDIPSVKEIRERFRRDVTLRSWRIPNQGALPSRLQLDPRQAELEDYFRRVAVKLEKRRTLERTQLQTREDLLRHARKVRRLLARMQGLATLPSRTPLRPKVKRAIETKTYCVNQVIFESRPGFYVSGNYYLPKGKQGPFPAVLHVCGHSLNGKAFHKYQTLCAALALKGLAVLSIDPAGQGERDEYLDLKTGIRTVVRACRMHAAAGTPMYLAGQNFGAIRLWDAMRAVDFLTGRSEIRKDRVGVTGASGGGWASLWLAALDPRIRAVHSSCYLTTVSQRIANRTADAEPDPEQDPFDFLSSGVDATDLLLACAPRAAALGATTRDFFPIEGTQKCFREAKAIFERVGLTNRLSLSTAKCGHSMHPVLRRHCIGWMLRWLDGQKDPEDVEPNMDPVNESRLWCTSTGSVRSSLGSRTSAEFTAIQVRTLALAWPRPTTKAGYSKRAIQIRCFLKEYFSRNANHRRIKFETTALPRKGTHQVCSVSFGAANTPWANATLWQNRQNCSGAPVIAIGLNDTARAIDPEQVCRRIATTGRPVLNLSLRGESHRNPTWFDFIPLEETVLASDALMLGMPLPILHAQDILNSLVFLSNYLDRPVGKVGVAGWGYGALPGLLAACMDKRIDRLCEIDPLTDFMNLACQREYAWPLKCFLPDILRRCDLPEIRATLAPRALSIYSPRDHLGRPLKDSSAMTDLKVVTHSYRISKNETRLTLMPGPKGPTLAQLVRFFGEEP